MSRIGQAPISLPSGVVVQIELPLVTVTGPKGALVQAVDPLISVVLDNNRLLIARQTSSRTAKALHGLTRQLLANLVTGVSSGFSKSLEMKGTGYRAEVQGADLVLSVGYSHPVRLTAPAGITFRVEKNTQITVEGVNRQVVGEIAARIRAVRKPEPYKGKGIRYSGEVIRLKPGKTAKAGA